MIEALDVHSFLPFNLLNCEWSNLSRPPHFDPTLLGDLFLDLLVAHVSEPVDLHVEWHRLSESVMRLDHPEILPEHLVSPDRFLLRRVHLAILGEKLHVLVLGLSLIRVG